MTLLTCSAVRRRLPAFYDRELPVRELIAVETHLNGCPPCARDLGELQTVGDALRGAAPAPADDWAGLQPGVISRMRAEEHDSWRAWAGRTFDDWHLVWIGLASTAASLLCGGLVLSMFYFASPSYRPDSLAGIFTVLSAPSGSDLNPARLDNRYRVPTVPHDSVVFAALERRTLESTEDIVVVPLSGIVRRDGWVSGLEAIDSADDRQDIEQLVAALSRGRFEPAQFGGSPVAVNLVWLVAHTTVKAKGRL
jgi:hypothetical protein